MTLEAHGNLGNTSRIGPPPRSRASYRRAVQLKSDYAEVHVNLGVYPHGDASTGRGEASFRRALEIKPDHAWHNIWLPSLDWGKTLNECAPANTSKFVRWLRRHVRYAFAATLNMKSLKNCWHIVTQCSIPTCRKMECSGLGVWNRLARSAIASIWRNN